MSLPEKIYETRKLTCYPNPADLELNFEIECHSAAKLSVISLLGTEVWSSEVRGTGKKILSWNLENESGQRVTPGIYFYLLESGKEKITGKVMVK
ncbi:MAG: T9SS type A sorting domain-containing protein [Bacteroidota bacterium]|nr:T9SS type A sorting domain-containing protein [Bacteroidota bacterium]